MELRSNSLWSDNIKTLLIIIVMYSYALERILLKNIDLTMPTFIVLILYIISECMVTKKIPMIRDIDGIIYIFILITFFSGIINNNALKAINVCIKSFFPYFIARFITIKDRNFFIKTINLMGYITIIALIINYSRSDTFYRVSIENGHPVAIGELVSFFLVTNYITMREGKHKRFNIINIVLGLIIEIVVLGARGALIAFIGSVIICEIFYFKNIKKTFFIITLCSLLYLSFNLYADNIIEDYPSLNRYRIETIIKDPSIVGGYGYYGRFGLLKQGETLFYQKIIFGSGVGASYAHNIFVDFMASYGIVGILMLLSLIFLSFKYIRNKNVDKLLIAMLFVAFIGRQGSFAMDAHKNLFILLGMIVSEYKEFNPKIKVKNLK